MAKRRGISQGRQLAIGAVVAVFTLAAVVGGVAYDKSRTSVAANAAAASYTAPDPNRYLGPTRLEVQRPTDRPLRVFFAGDSLTAGLHATEQNLSYRPLMLANWEQSGPVEGFRSERSGAGAATVSNLLDVPPDLDLAVVELGTNDVGTTDLVVFEEQYDALLNKIVGDTDTPLLCAGTWNNPAGAAPYDDVIKQTCTRRGGTYVSLASLFTNEAVNRGPAGTPTWAGPSDDFHPNDVGHAAIAESLLSRVAVA